MSWRIVASLTTAVLVFLFTGNVGLSLGVGFFDLVVKIVLYYVHERVWNTVAWGASS